MYKPVVRAYGLASVPFPENVLTPLLLEIESVAAPAAGTLVLLDVTGLPVPTEFVADTRNRYEPADNPVIVAVVAVEAA
jgi:hypothetical protein